MNRTIQVFASWAELAAPTLLGLLSGASFRGREQISFAFHPQWLKDFPTFRFDPDIPLAEGDSFPPRGKSFFGIFSDAAPDRWGRMLMKRRERQLAQREGRPEKTLKEIDFLLGVDDSGRMGGLRFKSDEGGPFLADDREFPTPPLTELRKLEHAALQIEGENPDDIDAAVAMLVRPGASLGGARPKANVVDPAGGLWIAKFPSASDDMDIGAWEYAVTSLSRASGVMTPETKLVKLGGRHHTFLTKRFDRSGGSRRHFYASAMTLLGKTDGDSPDSSYLEIAEFIISHGCRPKDQLEELWRRIVFNILVSNTDDHLRNHGFLYNFSENGWELSPAFDVNPIPHGHGLSLAIDEIEHSLSLDVAKSVAPLFQISASDAREIIENLIKIRSTWRASVKKLGIKNSEIDLMANIFECPR